MYAEVSNFFAMRANMMSPAENQLYLEEAERIERNI
jgi:hypothetical protein